MKNRVIKNLFIAVEEKKQKLKKTKRQSNIQRNKNNKKDGKAQRRKVIEKKVNEENRGKERNENKAENWYCQACKVDLVSDMRQCIDCFLWYHEECVGLSKNDIEEFLCPECN